VLVVILVVLAMTAVAVALIAGAHRGPITELDLEMARIDSAISAGRGSISVPEPRRPQQQELIKSA
jgi:hypothetical protein